MNCKLEIDSRLFDILDILEAGYESGNFEKLYPFLSPDCTLTSQWVSNSLRGYDAVADYYAKKGETLANSSVFPCCSIMELTSQEPGRLCLEMEQANGDDTVCVLVFVSIDDQGFVTHIELRDPSLYTYRAFYTYIDFLPSTEEAPSKWDASERNPHMIRVSESYYNELYLFFNCAEELFGEYDDLHIPMKKWCSVLEYWRVFIAAKNFDEAFETIAGVNYETGTVEYPDLARQLGRCGKSLWENRELSGIMLQGLIEWTNLYKDTYPFVDTYGW